MRGLFLATVGSMMLVAFSCGDDSTAVAPGGGGWDPDGGTGPDCVNGPNYTDCPCEEGETTVCYTGPADSRNVGACRDGVQTCVLINEFTGAFGPCVGEVLPAGCSRPEPECCTSGVGGPRLIAPLSTSRATTNLPALRWEGADEVVVTVCEDRACTQEIASFSASGGSATPPSALPAGVVFWRVEAMPAGSGQVSATWELKVPPRAAAVDTSWGSFSDVNGDGRSDLVLVDTNDDFAGNYQSGAPVGPPKLYVYLGAPTGLPAAPSQSVVISSGLLPFDDARMNANGLRVRSGDVNGDGYADIVVLGQLFLGGPTGLSSTPSWSFADPTLPQALPAPYDNFEIAYVVRSQDLGDVNGDGYADLVFAIGAMPYCVSGTPSPVAPPNYIGAKLYAFHGRPGGLSASSATLLDSFSAMTTSCADSLEGDCAAAVLGRSVGSVVVADMDGDGYADVLTSTLLPERAQLFRGSSAGLTDTPAQTLLSPSGDVCDEEGPWLLGQWAAGGDFDGDGYFDLVLGQAAQLGENVGKGLLYAGSANGFELPATEYVAQSDQVSVGNIQFGVHDGVRNGDVSGDGYADLLVGVLPSVGDPTGAELFLGSSTGLAHLPAAKLLPDSFSDDFAWFYTSANDDFNGDGLDDAVVSGFYTATDNARTVVCFVYYSAGGDAPLDATPSWILAPPTDASASCCVH